MKKTLALVIVFVYRDIHLFRCSSLPGEMRCTYRKVGDKWKWKPEPSGSETTGEVVDDTKDGFTLKLSSGTQIIYDKVTLNQKYIIESGRKTKAGGSLRKVWNFPLVFGKKWTDTIDLVGSRSGQPMTFLIEYRPERVEEVTTPAGTFKAFRIVGQGSLMSDTSNFTTFVVWYSPEVKFWIKREPRKEKGPLGPWGNMDKSALIEYSVAKD